jgi:hypothetical protein
MMESIIDMMEGLRSFDVLHSVKSMIPAPRVTRHIRHTP